MSTFSVIIPVYKVEREIRDCIESLVNQTYNDFEAIFIDDCGGDNSINIVREYAQNDDRIKIITQECNKGVSVARNTGLDNATGEFVVFLDADDWLELNALEILKQHFDRSNLDVVYYSYANCYPDKEKEIKKNHNDSQKDLVLIVDKTTIGRFVGVCWTCAIRNSLLKKLQVRFPEGLIVEDSEFTFRVFSQITHAVYTNDYLYNYRAIREGSYTTNDKANKRIHDELVIIERMHDFCKEKGLLEEYGYFILKLLATSIKKILYIEHEKEAILRKSNDLLIKMDFPKSFKKELPKNRFKFWMK